MIDRAAQRDPLVPWGLLTVQNDSHQRLVVAVQDFPQCKGLRRGFWEQAEEHGDGVVRRQTLRMDEPAPSEFTFIYTYKPLHTESGACELMHSDGSVWCDTRATC